MNKFLSACARFVTNIIIHFVGYDSRLLAGMRMLLGVPRKEARVVFRQFVRLHPLLAMSYTVLPIFVFVGVLFLIGMLGDALKNTPLDWVTVIENMPYRLSGVFFIIIYYGLSIIAAVFVSGRQRKRMMTLIEQTVTTPLCIYCGFDLSDREHSGGTAFCTDCGNTTPIRIER